MDQKVMEQVLAEEWVDGPTHFRDALTIGIASTGEGIAEVWRLGDRDVQEARRRYMANALRMARLLQKIHANLGNDILLADITYHEVPALLADLGLAEAAK